MAVRLFHWQKQTIRFLSGHWFAKQIRRSSCSDSRHERLSSRHYWKQKYKELEREDAFDWFLSPKTISTLADIALASVNPFQWTKNHSKQRTTEIIEKEHVNILDLGCGKSLFPKCLYDQCKQFPVAVFCLDYVQEAVEFQLDTAQTTQPGHGRNWLYGVCGSVRQLPFRSDSFSLVTDKGTMDALLKNFKDGKSQAREMLKEVHRVLHKDGIFMQITDEDPDSRLYFLQRCFPKSDPGQWTFSLLADEDRRHECFVYLFHNMSNENT